MPAWTAAAVLHTRICELFGVRYPIVQAGMGYLARVELVAAGSEAGGFGVLGRTGHLAPGELPAEIPGVPPPTSKPFSVNLLFPALGESRADRPRAAEGAAKVEVAVDE